MYMMSLSTQWLKILLNSMFLFCPESQPFSLRIGKSPVKWDAGGSGRLRLEMSMRQLWWWKEADGSCAAGGSMAMFSLFERYQDKRWTREESRSRNSYK